ncbi:MAG TPA: beta-eliminating lyase-related protein [Steroidobacteraceae bacterium]|nr:beta-eliminating lyase-related protein [Steroidobacteraceae bacterium]
MRFFKSDNTAAVSREILAAISDANHGAAVAYGTDQWSGRMHSVFEKFFETEVRVFAVSSGTAANSLALATLCPPWGTVLCHAEAHIERDECGAPEFFTGGAKLSLMTGEGAKIGAGDFRSRLDWFEPHVHGVQPRMLSITQATERGAAYTPAEIRALADIAHARGMTVHMDGARFANAVVSQDCSPAELSWKAGVDVLSFGVIKNGGMNTEAVVFFDPTRVADFEFRRKRGGQLACKGRYAAVQLTSYIESGIWRRNAERANRLAARIAAAAPELLSVAFETNQVFMQLGEERIAALSREFGFYAWGPAGSGEARFVCSWDTPEEDVDALCAALAKLR